MVTVAANDLKIHGVSVLQRAIAEDGEAIITIRGKDKLVIMSMDQYDHFRECELEAALIETEEDIKSGRVITESVEEHIKRIEDAL